MELISLLLAAGATQAVKALVRGQGPGQDELASVSAAAVEQLLGAVLAGQDETRHSLARIEQKIDAIVLDRYRVPLEVGFRNLREAAQPHRTPADRLRLLNEAEQQFATAVVSAPSSEDAVRAEVLSATCWLAKGSPADFHARSRHAAYVTLSALSAAYEHFAGPTTSKRSFMPNSYVAPASGAESADSSTTVIRTTIRGFARSEPRYAADCASWSSSD